MATIISLFDESGIMLEPWAEAGHICYAFDIKNRNTVKHYKSDGIIYYSYADLSDPENLDNIASLSPDILFGFPPCTDLASSGARHFDNKMMANTSVFQEAMKLVIITKNLGNQLSIPWIFENPRGLVSSLLYQPDYQFHPWEYGGYLPENDIHPLYPEYIPARDAYPKLTFIWAGNNFHFPVKKPVAKPIGFSPQYLKLGGKSEKTKRIRSATPRGFARAVYLANYERFVIERGYCDSTK